MEFKPPLIRGRLSKRYKRFLADIVLDTGEEVTAHCANPGSMMGLAQPGATVWVQPSTNPKRKLKYSWKLQELDGGGFAGIDTSVPNAVVGEALLAAEIPEVATYRDVLPEQRYAERSRVDFLLREPGLPDLYLEVKNVHLCRRGKTAEFPDSVTARGAKHLRDLSSMVALGHRAMMFYFVQMTGCESFGLAEDLDPAYAAAFREAVDAGVEAIVYDTDISPDGIRLRRRLAFDSLEIPDRSR